MGLNNYGYILKEIPIFVSLSDKERAYIEKKSGVAEYKKGQIIYKEGSAPSYFYCIFRGRVVISTLDYYGKQTILECLHRGKYFGVISVLTGEPHSVTAKAINDCLLLTISKDDFDSLLKKIPQLAIDLSKTLSRRLKRKDIHQKTIFESTIIAVLSSFPQAGKTVYASNLALSISKEAHKKVVIVDICPQDKVHRLPRILNAHSNYRIFNLSGRAWDIAGIKDYIFKDKSGIDIIYLTYGFGYMESQTIALPAYANDNQSWPREVVDILSLLVNDYHYVILDLPSLREEANLSILNQSDTIHILTSPKETDLKSTRRLIKKLESDFNFTPAKIKVIVNENRPSNLALEQEIALLSHDIFAKMPKIETRASGRLVLETPDAEYSKVLRRIARQEGDCLVGLALGVGVAYGFCHIGVLKVIEEEKIPIDVISGSSIGGVIAGLWATGRSSSEILKITKEFSEPKFIWSLLDFTFPLRGFIKGNKMYNFLKRYFGKKTFYDIKIPLKIIASDVKRKETRIFDQGSLVDAIMASCTMPGVFTPFTLKGEMLFDGGIMNPLPTEPLCESGVKKIIAVNLTPSREDIIKQRSQIKENIAGMGKEVNQKYWFNLKEYLRRKLKINILDFIFSSFEIMQSEVAQKEAEMADVVLHPDTSGLHWMELHKSEEFAKRGEEETRRNLDKIWKVINE